MRIMRSKSITITCITLCAAILALSCATPPSNAMTATDADVISMINSNCYEVVVKKPVKDSMVYEKPLNWDLVDFRIRNDKYVGVGTAFAISETELVTAAHVLGINQESLVYAEKYVRQKTRNTTGQIEEKVWEIDTVRAYSSNRDYVVFTLKDFAAPSWFKKAEKLDFNKKIFTAGNAYGEGIVIREGLLLDSLPESENGEWEYLKSSIATNPGNSGGPLLNERFEVIGIVLQRKDDFCYALNIHDIIPDKAIFHLRTNFGFAVFNKQINRTYDAEAPLPMKYTDLIKWHAEEDKQMAEAGMKALLETNKEDLFPAGENSIKALYTRSMTSFPQMFLQSDNDLAWFMTNVKTGSSDIGLNGQIYWAEPYENAGIFLLDIEHPDDVPAAAFTDSPKVLMDHILKGIKFERKLTNDDSGTRILSMGEPVYSGTHVDRWGRKWNVNHWLMEFSDQLIIIFSTPTPQGVSMLYKETASYDREEWMWDMGHMTDYVNVSYMGTLVEWERFFARKDFLFGSLARAMFSFKDGEAINLGLDDFTLKITNDVIKVEDKTSLVMNMNVFPKNGLPVWDVRRVLVSEKTDSTNYAMILHLGEPNSKLPKAFIEEWQKLAVERQHPYTRKAFVEEGNSKIGGLHSAFVVEGKTVPLRGCVYSLYLSRSGSVDEQMMARMFETLEKNTEIK